PLQSGANTLVVSGLDAKGRPVASVSGAIHITYTGPNELPQDKLVINEIMYNPVFANAGYVEILNTSAGNAFDLSGWRLSGAGTVFSSGTIIEPGAYMILAKDPMVFAITYGASIPVQGQLGGDLEPG